MIRTPKTNANPRSGLAPRSAILFTLVGGGALAALYFLVESTTSRAADRSAIEHLSPPPEIASAPVEEPEVELLAPDVESDEPPADTSATPAPPQPEPSVAPAATAETATALPLDRTRFLKPALAEAAARPPRVPPGPPLQYSKSQSNARETVDPTRMRLDQYKKQKDTPSPDRVDSTVKKQRRAKRAPGNGTSGG